MFERDGEVVQRAGELPVVAELSMGSGGLTMKARRIREAAEFLVRLARSVVRGGFAASVAQFSLDRRGSPVGVQRVGGPPPGSCPSASSRSQWACHTWFSSSEAIASA